jgi:hypothetical protein
MKKVIVDPRSRIATVSGGTHSWRKWLAGTRRSGRAHCRCSRPARSMRSSGRSRARRRPLGGCLSPFPRRGHAHSSGGDRFRLAPRTFHGGDRRRLAAPWSNGAAHRHWAQDLRKSLAPFLCRVATPTCWGRMTANRRRLLMAITPPGSAPSSVASIPIGSSRLRSRCRRGGPVRLRLKRISS